MGGVDLCFGRWDTPQHILIDDPDLEGEGSTQIWPGKNTLFNIRLKALTIII